MKMRIGCPDLLSNISGGPETHRTSVYSRTQLKRRLIASYDETRSTPRKSAEAFLIQGV